MYVFRLPWRELDWDGEGGVSIGHLSLNIEHWSVSSEWRRRGAGGQVRK